MSCWEASTILASAGSSCRQSRRFLDDQQGLEAACAAGSGIGGVHSPEGYGSGKVESWSSELQGCRFPALQSVAFPGRLPSGTWERYRAGRCLRNSSMECQSWQFPEVRKCSRDVSTQWLSRDRLLKLKGNRKMNRELKLAQVI